MMPPSPRVYRDLAAAWMFIALFVIASWLLIGCSSEDGDRDLAGASTGGAVEVHCAGLQRALALERFPTGIGDTTSTVTCASPQTTPTPLPVTP